jgi:prolyl-tRNA editing enzyme YbaK/EbsC (Cys-tRNA(Pro) deacylase)
MEVDKLNMNTLEEIKSWLDENHTEYRVIEHPVIDGTASGSSLISGTNPEKGAKSLVMITNSNEPIMVVVSGPDKVDFGKVKKASGSHDVRLSSLQEIGQITNLTVGTLHPFGNLLNLRTFFDQNLLSNDEIICGTGSQTQSLIIKTDGLKKNNNFVIGDFSKK